MAANDMDMILSELGWQDGFRIPVANEENKCLEDKVKRILRDLAILFSFFLSFFHYQFINFPLEHITYLVIFNYSQIKECEKECRIVCIMRNARFKLNLILKNLFKFNERSRVVNTRVASLDHPEDKV